MLGEEYTLEYLPLFDEELAAAVRYIAVVLENPAAAAKLVDDVERAINRSAVCAGIIRASALRK